jgi:aspartate 4-decarboxylase
MTVDHICRAEILELQQLSPFELKNKLGALAGEHERRTAFQMLNAGRGNPNFIAPTPREAFFQLGFFALEECRANVEWDPELVGVPQRTGIAGRFATWLDAHQGEKGVDLLRRTLDYGVAECGFVPDSFVWELADAVIGDHYPEPDRMLHHAEQIVHRYLLRELCGGRDDLERSTCSPSRAVPPRCATSSTR